MTERVVSYSIELYGPGLDGTIVSDRISGPFLRIEDAEAKALRLGEPGPGQIKTFGGKPPMGYRIIDDSNEAAVRSGVFRIS
jgi:hypothetical protein